MPVTNDVFTVSKEYKTELKQAVDVLHLIYKEIKILKPLIDNETEKQAADIYLTIAMLTSDIEFLKLFKDSQTLYKFIELSEINQTPFDIITESGIYDFSEFKEYTQIIKNEMLSNIKNVLAFSCGNMLVDVMFDKTQYKSKPDNKAVSTMVSKNFSDRHN